MIMGEDFIVQKILILLENGHEQRITMVMSICMN